MNRDEFISELKSRLAKLPESEISKTISFYNEIIDDRIDDGMAEIEAVESLGSLDNIEKEILLETPLATLIQDKIKKSHNNSMDKKRWSMVAMCTSPIWVPIALALTIGLGLVHVSIWLVILLLIATECSLIAAGIIVLISSIPLFYASNLPLGLAMSGISLICIGLFIMTIKPSFWLNHQFMGFTTLLMQKIKKQFISKEGDK